MPRLGLERWSTRSCLATCSIALRPTWTSDADTSSAARDVCSDERRRADGRHVPNHLTLERLVRASSDVGPSQTGMRVNVPVADHRLMRYTMGHHSKPPGAGKPERRCREVATDGAAIRDSRFEADVSRPPL